MPILFLRVIFQGAIMVLVQRRICLIPYFVLLTILAKKKGAYLQDEWDFKAAWVERIVKSGKEIDCPGCCLVLVSVYSSCFFWLYSLLFRATKTTLWLTWRANWIKNGKEADMWVWQLILTPTHWESKNVYCFSWYLVFGDILFVAVIFKAIQLLYFERWVWEKPFLSFGTSPRFNLPVTATVLCQSFSGRCLWMKPQETWPVSPKY